MNAQINDGDSAFPVSGMTGLPNDQIAWPEPGMALRDYFAINADLSEQALEKLTSNDARRLGVPMPEGPGYDPKAWFKWRADVRAFLRYLEADAMLRAREVQP